MVVFTTSLDKNRVSSSRFVQVSVSLIILIHLLGFIMIDAWMEFSGIEAEAQNMQRTYGRVAVYILNLLAVLLFTGILLVLNFSHSRPRFHIIGAVISAIFVIRGFMGYIATMLGALGSATPFWEVVFSTWALVTGIFGLLAYRGGN